MKSIDRLREYTNGDALRAGMSLRTARDGILAHIDAIEFEVKELTDERDLLKTQWEAGVDFDQRLESAASERADVTLFGVDYVALPVDADGVPIHVGDVIAYEDNTKPKEVVALVPPSIVIVEDGPRYADMCRHYHAPTVEDVLYDLLRLLEDEAAPRSNEWRAEQVAECAAKLRLAESE